MSKYTVRQIPGYKLKRRQILAEMLKAVDEDDDDIYAACYDALRELELEACEYDEPHCRCCDQTEEQLTAAGFALVEKDLCDRCEFVLIQAGIVGGEIRILRPPRVHQE